MEALRSHGYTLEAWDRESVGNKARVIGHYLHRMHREGYEAEMARKKAKGKDGGKGDMD